MSIDGTRDFAPLGLVGVVLTPVFPVSPSAPPPFPKKVFLGAEVPHTMKLGFVNKSLGHVVLKVLSFCVSCSFS